MRSTTHQELMPAREKPLLDASIAYGTTRHRPQPLSAGWPTSRRGLGVSARSPASDCRRCLRERAITIVVHATPITTKAMKSWSVKKSGVSAAIAVGVRKPR